MKTTERLKEALDFIDAAMDCPSAAELTDFLTNNGPDTVARLREPVPQKRKIEPHRRAQADLRALDPIARARVVWYVANSEVCDDCNGYGVTYQRPHHSMEDMGPFETPCETCNETGAVIRSLGVKPTYVSRSWKTRP